MFTSIEKKRMFLLVSDLLWNWYCMSMGSSFLSTCPSLEENAVTFKLCQIYIKKYLYEDCDVMLKKGVKSQNAVINISFLIFC